MRFMPQPDRLFARPGGAAPQEENAALVALVESSSRKARHLAGELSDAQRNAEDLFTAHLRLQASRGAPHQLPA